MNSWKKWTALVLAPVAFAATAKAENFVQLQTCEIEMVQLGKGITTPLHQEAEWILQKKGYHLNRTSALQPRSVLNSPLSLQARYRAGDESISGQADCLTEDYQELGKRANCHYELTLVASDPLGQRKPFFRVRQSIRQSLDMEGFYDRVRSQLAQVPACLIF